MTEDDVVHIVRSYIEGLFPKVCSNCGRRFESLRDYLKTTTHLATPVLYDNITDSVPEKPLGPMSLASCPCGTTLGISSLGIPLTQMIELMTWARTECKSRSISVRELLRHIRDRIDRQVLEGPEDELRDAPP
jgi:hypothetical protein